LTNAQCQSHRQHTTGREPAARSHALSGRSSRSQSVSFHPVAMSHRSGGSAASAASMAASKASRPSTCDRSRCTDDSPASRRCTCESISPGVTTAPSRSSVSLAATTVAGSTNSSTRPASTNKSRRRGVIVSPFQIRQFVTRRSIFGSNELSRTAVPLMATMLS